MPSSSSGYDAFLPHPEEGKELPADLRKRIDAFLASVHVYQQTREQSMKGAEEEGKQRQRRTLDSERGTLHDIQWEIETRIEQLWRAGMGPWPDIVRLAEERTRELVFDCFDLDDFTPIELSHAHRLVFGSALKSVILSLRQDACDLDGEQYGQANSYLDHCGVPRTWPEHEHTDPFSNFRRFSLPLATFTMAEERLAKEDTRGENER